MPAAELGPQGVRYDRRFMLMTKKRSKTQTLTKMQLSDFPECALFSQEIVSAKEGEFQTNSDDGGNNKVVVVHYHPPARDQDGSVDSTAKSKAANNSKRTVMSPVQHPPLRIPLEPSYASLQPLDINLHGSPTRGYRMGDPYDAWFSAVFGFDVVLVYIGDGQRQVLGDSLKVGVPPPKKSAKRGAEASLSPSGGSILGLVLSYLVGAWLALLAALGLRAEENDKPDEPWITFSDCAPLLITAESSLRNVSSRMSEGVEVPMYKFRPNIVVDGEGEEEWAEDYWGELTVTPGAGLTLDESSATSTPSLSRSRSASSLSSASSAAEKLDKASPTSPVRLLLTSNCGRCTSLNVDYATGAMATGELGEVLKRMAKDRRVDPGSKYSPVFGRYAFLDRRSDENEKSRGGGIGRDGGDEDAEDIVHIAVGDEVTVTRRNTERTVWDWPGL